MTNNVVTEYVDSNTEDDGFTGSVGSGRVLKGTLLKWTDNGHWQDRDGITPPQPLLIIAINEILQKWKDNKSEVITDKPLPDPEELNSSIPVNEWDKGIDSKPRPPWAHTIVVYFVDLGTGAFYTYMAATAGAHMAWNHLREAVIGMRALRGVRCMPVVNLREKPFKTSFGMRARPHLEIIGWRTPGGDVGALPRQATPQIAPPRAAPAPTATLESTSAAATAPEFMTPAAPQAAAAAAAASSPKQARQPKQPVTLSDYTLAVMGEPKPVTVGEELNDEIPW
jgi:hypothetical protein